MLRLRLLASFTLLLLVGGCAATPPSARRVPHQLVAHGHTRIDDYFWLRDREAPETLAYLAAENAYTAARLAPLRGFEDALFDEIVARIKPDDDTVPYRERDFFYYVRFAAGQEYPIFCRKRGSLDAAEEIMLDSNPLAAGHDFFSIRAARISSGQNILAFATDTVGRRFYDIRFKDLTTGALLDETIPQVTANVVWAEDGKTIFYAKQHPETLRWYQIYRHVLGTDPASDTLVYEEPDETFSVYVGKTTSRAYLVIAAEQTLSSEVRLVPADRPDAPPALFWPREREHEYAVDHLGDTFFVRSNWQAKNFRLLATTDPAAGKEGAREVAGHRDDVLLEGFDLFTGHLVLTERREGLVRLRIRALADGAEHELDFGEAAYVAWPTDNLEPATTTLRYWYSSLTTPDSIIDYDMVTREKTLRKRDVVVGDFDGARYQSERLFAPAADGRQVPISLVYRRDRGDGPRPLVLYGYGAYGASSDPQFDSALLSLLDRGVAFAIAHVRGCKELGRWWYEEGKLGQKMFTFTDFIACAEHLVARGVADPARLFAYGGSAGGLLIGAVINLRPTLFAGAVADVPFVDVVTTMLDETIPLTTSEYDEWGNPNDEADYWTMLAYSPYDNVFPRPYPHLLVTTSLHDSQVQYWEPAKWVAKLRATSTGDNLLLLQTDMAAGHGGKSGRLKQHRDTALRYAFLLHLAGLAR